MKWLEFSSIFAVLLVLFIKEYNCSEIEVAIPPPPGGGQRIVNRSDPTVVSAAEWAVDKLNEIRGFSEETLRLSLIQIDNGTQQEKRQIPPPGGQKLINASDPLVIGAAEWAVDELNEQRGFSETMLRWSLIKIDNGTQQVVDGEIYRLIIHAGESACLNSWGNIGKTEKECPPLYPYPIVSCEVIVLGRNWSMSNTYFYHLMNYTCQEPITVEKRDDPMILDVNDLSVIHAADLAVNEINRVKGYSCCEYRDSVESISSARLQNTPTGKTYDLVVTIGQSFCTNNFLNRDRASASCPIQPGLQLRTCSVKVSVTNDKQLQALVNHNCHYPWSTNSPVVG